MKTTALLLLLASAALADDLPNKVKDLITKRELAYAKIDESYVEELSKLQTHYTKQGNLDVALAIRELIEETPSTNKPLGEWRFIYKGLPRNFNFSEDNKFVGHFPVSGKQFHGEWQLRGKVVALKLDGKSTTWARIILSSNSSARFSQGPYQMTGSKIKTK